MSWPAPTRNEIGFVSPEGGGELLGAGAGCEKGDGGPEGDPEEGGGENSEQ